MTKRKTDKAPPIWPPEMIEALTRHWHDGKSAGQISRLMPQFTRNAIIGKASRLGLDGRQSPIIRTPSPRPPMTAAQRMRKVRAERARAAGIELADRQTAPKEISSAPAPVLQPRRPVEEHPGATLLMLTDHICRWPIGDPRHPDFHFCGHASAEGLPYCDDHAARAYQPMSHFRERVA